MKLITHDVLKEKLSSHLKNDLKSVLLKYILWVLKSKLFKLYDVISLDQSNGYIIESRLTNRGRFYGILQDGIIKGQS